MRSSATAVGFEGSPSASIAGALGLLYVCRSPGRTPSTTPLLSRGSTRLTTVERRSKRRTRRTPAKAAPDRTRHEAHELPQRQFARKRPTRIPITANDCGGECGERADGGADHV